MVTFSAGTPREAPGAQLQGEVTVKGGNPARAALPAGANVTLPVLTGALCTHKLVAGARSVISRGKNGKTPGWGGISVPTGRCYVHTVCPLPLVCLPIK